MADTNSANKYTVPPLHIAFLISCYMFQHNCHRQGAYISIVKTCSDKKILQFLRKLNVLLLIWIYLSAIGSTPGGSSTVHIYTQTIH
jgi:hypothetical protein